MPKLNVFIDGSWLFNACRHDRALASATEFKSNNFNIDFAKLNAALLKHVTKETSLKEELTPGDFIISTSIFDVPDSAKDWPMEYPTECTSESIEKVKNGVFARERFVKGAFEGGYQDKAIFRPRLKPYIVSSLGEGRYQEKQVDATIVAMVVKYAITCPQDYHILISGDKDMLPAIEIACPEFTVNVSVATTHPDGLETEQRQSSFTLFSYDFAIKPFILDEHTEELMAGAYVYKCRECGKTFSRSKKIPAGSRPLCTICHRKKKPFAVQG